MMIIKCWNVRGLNSPLKQHEVVNLMKKSSVDVCGLLETKLSLSKVLALQKFRLKQWNFLSNATQSSMARIVIFWNPTTVSVDLVHVSSQGLHVCVRSLVSQICFHITFVYGLHTIAARRSLWDNLCDWSPPGPWLVLGDFNSLLSQADKLHGCDVSQYETADFHKCCLALGLYDLNYTGCHFTWTNGLVWSKLDRVLVNPFWSSLHRVAHVHFGNQGAFSDHSPALVRLDPQVIGQRSFKFFNMWASHTDFLHTVSESWQLEVIGSPMFSLCKKLKGLKRPLKLLDRLHFSHISERVSRAESDLDLLQTALHSDPSNSQLVQEDKKLRIQLINLKSSEKMFFGQKLKCDYLKESDRGSRFFHALLSQRHGRNFIPAIQKSDGSLSVSEKEVGFEFVDFFMKLYGSMKPTLPLDRDIVSLGPCLSASDCELLSAPFSNDDVKAALFGIDNIKAPGPDGFTSFFFKSAWSVVGDDFCSAVQDFFSHGKMLKQINHSVIALIPKSGSATSPCDFRPISCCNVIYKVISKLLAGRLAVALGRIISPLQNAFLGGRAMVDNINLVQELLRQYGRKRTSPKSLMKIDFKKAFDSIQWQFLRDLLLSLRFPSSFVHLVMQCVETTSFSVVINGNLYGFFPGKSGIRQGDPLSPYLFITCMEYFSRLLSKASQHSAFKFHPQCEPLGINHLAFADDVLLLARGDKPSILFLLDQLRLFGRVSGLEINPSKSSIFLGGVHDGMRQEILLETGFSAGSFPFKYLGVPLSPHRLLVSQFSPLLRKLEAAVQNWVGKHLSFAGRLELLRSVLYGMVQFWLCIFPVPDTVILQIVRICRNFLWTGNVQNSHSALVAWKSVCLPKKEGGLGLFDVKARNKSFLVKHLWNIHQEADSLWIKWIHHFFLPNLSIWDAQSVKSSSPLWKNLISLKNNLLADFGGSSSVVDVMTSWKDGDGGFSANAYDHFRVKGRAIRWDKVVWESWSLPKHSFVLWLAVLGKLRTKDRLHFIPSDLNCVFCNQEPESHCHLFFQCPWTSSFWGSIARWLHLPRQLPTLSSAIRGLAPKKKSTVHKMRRASLSIVVYLLWEERNKRLFDNSTVSIDKLFRRFQVLFFTVFHFHGKDHFSIDVG